MSHKNPHGPAGQIHAAFTLRLQRTQQLGTQVEDSSCVAQYLGEYMMIRYLDPSG